MRWNNLFDDLESQLEHELTAEDVDLQAEEERLRIGRLSLRDRLLALHEAGSAHGAPIRLVLVGGKRITLRPAAFGKDWFSADTIDGTTRRSQYIVPIAGIAGLILDRGQVPASLRGRPNPEAGRALSNRLGLAFVLRDLCRRRTAVELLTAEGSCFGTIDRVGRDHLDLALHEPGQPRRESAVSEYRVIVLREILLVRL